MARSSPVLIPRYPGAGELAYEERQIAAPPRP